MENDKGFVKLVDYMGSDQAILNAARVSTGAESNPKRDRGLIRYLYRNKHSTPFEMAEFKFHIKAPIFVARQWLRHRTASVNETSARYRELPTEFYDPDQWRKQSEKNRQATDEPLTESEANEASLLLASDYEKIGNDYTYMLNYLGVAREQARVLLPLSVYTEWYWKIDLHNLFHFLELRVDSHAQAEIREYAQAILDILEGLEEFKWSVEIFNQMRELNSLIRKALNKDKQIEKLPDVIQEFINEQEQ